MRVWGHIANTLDQGAACVLVTVASVAGSTPREVGARMIVLEDGGFYGTIGGGTLEFEAIKAAQRFLQSGDTGLTLRRMSLGPDLGQCCGGAVQIAFEVFSSDQRQNAIEFAKAELAGVPFSTQAKVSDGKVERSNVEPHAHRFHLESGCLLETFGEMRRPVYLFGAGHVGKAVVLALAPLPFQVTWIDSRKDVFPSAVPQNVRKVHAANPADILENAPAEALVLAMTHCHAMDEEIMAVALGQQRFQYCGVIGSKTKRARFLSRLKKRELPACVVADMVCPIGVPEIRSKHPAAIAAGIACDLLQREEIAQNRVNQPEGLEIIRTISR